MTDYIQTFINVENMEMNHRGSDTENLIIL